MATDSDHSTVSTSVSPELKREIRIKAARQDRPMSELIREAIHDWADEQGIGRDNTNSPEQ